MRKKIVAGNWKMNLNLQEASELYKGLNQTSFPNDVEIIVAPPSLYLSQFSKVQNNISLAGQNVNDNEKGAFTGEISAEMLSSIRLKYCIIGHSERRAIYKESNAQIKSKLDLLLKNNITPILCCGETLQERESGNAFTTVLEQIKEATKHLSAEDYKKVILAYEPVWAIGTGVTASSEQAQEMHAAIRTYLAETIGNVSAEISILYGGSCKPENAKELFACNDIDGGLIGGAALKVDSFTAIAHSF